MPQKRSNDDFCTKLCAVLASVAGGRDQFLVKQDKKNDRSFEHVLNGARCVESNTALE